MRTKKSLLVAILMMASAITASATEFRSFDRNTQIGRSELILTGRVVSVSSKWRDDRSAIYTDAAIAIDSVWKGLPDSDRVVVRTLGGTVGGVRLEVEGAATFAPGEEVLVFLSRSNGAYTPAGMRYGKYQVVGAGDRAVAVGLLPPSSPEARAAAPVSLSLASLRTEVESAK